ncbi:MAG: hypothetical protein OHK006_19840 [Thermodesulfovibrionales bacterium]
MDCLSREDGLIERERRYRLIFENTLSGYAYCRMIFEGGSAADFVYLSVNTSFEKLTGFSDVIGKKASEVIPDIRTIYPHLFETCGRVALTGKPGKLEMRVGAGGDWLSVMAFSPEKEHFVAVFDVITQQKQTEEDLRASRERYRKLSQDFNGLLDAIPDRLVRLDPDLSIVWANRSTPLLPGSDVNTIIGSKCHRLFHDSDAPVPGCPVVKSFRTGSPANTTITDNDKRMWDIRTIPLKDETGKVVSVIELGRDITEHRKMEAQFLQAQKMEAIGRLAAGIAHDFNNVLGAMGNYMQLLGLHVPESGPVREYADQMLILVDRATSLTQGLLAFSRKRETNAVPVDLNSILQRLQKLLPRMIGEDIEIVVETDGTSCTVMADSLQIEQALMNLATNARDAMPDGGTLSIRTETQEIDSSFVHAHGFGEPGFYGVIVFADTGSGMDETTRRNIFDPFFTTKEPGRGTGLGLAVVYGIVKQHKGYITVYSEPGQGTVFRIYLPMTDRSGALPQYQPPAQPIETGRGETILVAEDDEPLRDGMEKMLVNFGYRPLVAKDGQEAVELFRAHKDFIDLALLDVIMPKKNGKEVAESLRQDKPGVPVLFTSGYFEKTSSGQRLLSDDDECIAKPVQPLLLLKRIRELIDTQDRRKGDVR